MTKHTPAPWYIEEQHEKFGGYFIHHNADETQSNDDVIASDIKSYANARLIAAAPELLEALEKLVGNIYCVDVIEPETGEKQKRWVMADSITAKPLSGMTKLQKARAVIAKVKGEV